MDGNLLVLEDAAYGDVRAGHRLDDRDVRTRMQVVTIALEVLVGVYAHGRDQIARRCTLHTRLATTLDTNLLPIVYAEGNLDGEMLAIGNAPLTLAFGTGLDRWCARVPPQSGQVTAVCMVAEERMLHAHDMTRAVAGRTFDLRTVLGGTAATAFLAGGEAIVDDVLLRAAGDFLEREAKPIPMSRPSPAHLLGSSAAHAAEEGTEDVAHATEDVTHVDSLINHRNPVRPPAYHSGRTGTSSGNRKARHTPR